MFIRIFAVLYVFITGILLITFEFYIFKRISSRHENIKQTLEQEKNVTLKVSHHQLIVIHAGVWAALLWLTSTIFFFESLKTSFVEIFFEWNLFFSVLFLGAVVLDLSIHVLLNKMFFYLSNNEIRYRLDFTEHILHLDDIAFIQDIERKFVITFNSGKKTYIDKQGLAFLGWLSPVKEYLNEIKIRIENQ
jgi:hypothetical protein